MKTLLHSSQCLRGKSPVFLFLTYITCIFYFWLTTTVSGDKWPSTAESDTNGTLLNISQQKDRKLQPCHLYRDGLPFLISTEPTAPQAVQRKTRDLWIAPLCTYSP